MPMLVVTKMGCRGQVQFEGLAHDLEQAFGDQFGRHVQRRAVNEHDELVAAHPPYSVDVAQSHHQPGRDGDRT